MDIEQLKYPIGVFEAPIFISDKDLKNWISEIEIFPEKLNQEITNISSECWDIPYRPQGWSAKQIIHHLADSHMNSFIRIKLALTEEKPVIKPYFEDKWGELPDNKEGLIEPSLNIIKGVHARWTFLLKNLNEKDYSRSFIHPESNKEISIKEAIGFYAWHGLHHLAHIKLITKKNTTK